MKNKIMIFFFIVLIELNIEFWDFVKEEKTNGRGFILQVDQLVK